MEHIQEINAECVGLLVHSECGAIEVAKKFGVPFFIVSVEEIISTLKNINPDLIVLAGYMRKISEEVLENFENKIINIHPALLPAFGGKGCYGIHVHEKVLEAGVKITGVTVHFVNKNYDEGKIIAQAAVPVLENDTPEILAKRVLSEEHNLYWQVIKNLN
jgi:formyltetrahydrofolate-dependent phosphoribosylglycinamide formyltransferase